MEGDAMPLSDHEQKILTDLEASLSKHDPQFAKKVSSVNIYNRRHRRMILGVVGFTIGFAILVIFFTQSLALGLIGLAVMIASSLVLALGVAQARDSARSRSVTN
jgi:hypothetical protein